MSDLHPLGGALVCYFVGFNVAPTHYRAYGDFPALMVEEDPRCPSVHYFITSGHLGRTTDLLQASWMASSHEEFNAPSEERTHIDEGQVI